MDFDEKLNEIRTPRKEDFKFIMIALDNTTKALEGVTKEMGTIKGRMARQEERFEMMLDAVQQELKNRVNPSDFAQLVQRVEVIETKINPAA